MYERFSERSSLFGSALVGTDHVCARWPRIFSRVISRALPFRSKKEARVVSSSMASPNRVQALYAGSSHRRRYELSDELVSLYRLFLVRRFFLRVDGAGGTTE